MYRDVSVPEGRRGPNVGDTVRVHYTGRLEARAVL
jgi:FKBP-type peptidyl-prolyl cis-trans isomerase